MKQQGKWSKGKLFCVISQDGEEAESLLGFGTARKKD
jgi:hypothetical protein